ncbi:pentapeptide repeat-containing protein [Streptomyces longispororuber]|uniref:pentapeptide repeat-containing protein n=1 Tax=Streptomyces longispororuber TaxID=68230 RepID=UPI00210ADF4F|nr:pentapeptide repeat-containing protein [Streptomyces longispororuber]MCQ4208910.1 pentapeptide repeat-containing protein [Streptomyces longispororuber]
MNVDAARIRREILDEGAGSEPYVLRDARISGALTLDGAEIRRAVRFEACRFEEPVRLEGATTLGVGIVRCTLPGLLAPTTRFGGRLDLRGSTIGERDGADPAVDLVHADVAGGLRLDGAHLVAPGRAAIEGGGLVARGGVFCEGGFVAEGEVGFPGAELPGGLWLRGARITVGSAQAYAFHGDAVRTSNVRLQGLRTDGRIRLRGAQVDDLVSLEGAELGGTGSSVMCVGMRTEALDLRFARTPAGGVNLRNAHASRIQDDPRTWPANLGLDGLTYDWLGETATDRREDVTNRLAWLRHQPHYAPQPYEQLAAHYRRSGQEAEARRVLLVRERTRRATLGPAGRAWGRLLDATVGYGYRPWLAGIWLALLTLLGSAVFAAHTPVANKKGEGPPFHAVPYALDLMVPIGGLGQRDGWHWAEPGVQGLAYGLIAVGWILTTTVVAGVTRTLSRG